MLDSKTTTAVVFAAALALCAGSATARTIQVTTTADVQGGPECSLRDAITAANTNAATGGCKAGKGADRIKLGKQQTYVLSTPGTGEDGNLTGDLDIWSELWIDGRGSTIDGGGLDRVIEVLPPASPGAPTSVGLSSVRIVGGNSPSDGGGVHCSGNWHCLLVNSEVSGNVTTGSGGGIDVDQDSLLELRSTTVGGNIAGVLGGGINCGSEAVFATRLLVSQSTVSGNQTLPSGARTGNAGGIALVNGCEGVIVNSTVSGNSVGGNPNFLQGIAGGIGVLGETGRARLELIHTTVAANSATLAGGVATFVLAAPGAFTETVFENTIVAGNSDLLGARSCFVNTGAALLTSLGHNIEDRHDGPGPLPGSQVGCRFLGPGDLIDTDPMLGGLADNGGPTWTHAILAGSPAIDAADDLTCAAEPVGGVDQRKVDRPQGAGCDVGAFELE